MHVGFLSPEYPNAGKPEGGLGNYIRKTALELIRRGHRVTVFVLVSRHGYWNDEGVNLKFITKVKIHWRFKQSQVLASWLALYEQWVNAHRIRHAVFGEHRKFPLDIVQTPNYKIPGNALIHNPFFPLVCRCSSYSPMLRAAGGMLRGLPDSIIDWMETRQVIEAQSAFTPSQFIAGVYERFEAVRPLVIRTPLELPDLQQDDSIYRKMCVGKPYLLYFGALNGVKGVDVLIRAAPHFLSKYHDINLLFIGRNDALPGGVKAADQLQNALHTYWQEKRVRYHPALPKAQLFPLVQHAIGVIMPSRVDNYPNACLEALSFGVPVVGTYDSSLDEMIVDGKTGFLFENGNPMALCEAVDRLMSLTGLGRQQMRAEMALEVNRISSEDRVGQLVSYYESVIDRSKM